MLDYEKKFRAAFKENTADCPRAALAGELDAKINQYCKMHGFEYGEMVAALQTDKYLAPFFVKNPNKQNLCKNAAARHIQKMRGVKNLRVLSNKKFYVVSGAVVPREQLMQQGGSAEAKTIDFRWEFGGLEFYACHKYTKDSGGSQDNQYKDIQAFIRNCNNTTAPGRHFVAIADGDYYNTQNGQAGVAKRQRLKDLAGGGKVHACTIDELPDLLDAIKRRRR